MRPVSWSSVTLLLVLLLSGMTPAQEGIRQASQAINDRNLPKAASGPVVRVEICENGLNDTDEWPSESPVATEIFEIPAFALNDLPARYVDDGVRAVRPSPSLIRMTATVRLPAGKHRILVRSRSTARLYYKNDLVLETPFPPKNGGDGSLQDTVQPEPIDLGVGYRFAPQGEIERIVEYETPDGDMPIILEAFVGGREGGNRQARRVELGETVLAIALSGTDEWLLMSPSMRVPYTDPAWQVYQRGVKEMLRRHESNARAKLREQFSSYWDRRHENGAAWLNATRDEPIPALPAGMPAINPIDHFIASRFDAVRAEHRRDAANDQQNSIDYFRDVRPLLESRCLGCHSGIKPKGNLRLESRDLLLKGGDSGPAVVAEAAKSELIRRITSQNEDVMPPTGNRLTPPEVDLLTQWVRQGTRWPQLPLAREEFTPPADDLTFLRRVMLDTVGIPPTIEETRSFLADTRTDKRQILIDRLLQDPRWADHWMPLWQDLLAENPNILNPTLNNTGPFRWWLYDAMRDDLPIDRLVTQLILQKGSSAAGGPAGFGLATQNDSPFAAKGTIISAAFLGIDTKCARCHDSPTGSARQEQLFQLGAMLAAAPLKVPKTSSVDPDKLHAGGRQALIEVTLMPGTEVAPAWPFSQLVQLDFAGSEFEKQDSNQDPQVLRRRLAYLLTSPQNERFAQVIANRVWARFMGRGIVEPLDDWEKGKPTHPELLRWLGREFVRHNYQIKPIASLILNSAAYQRTADKSLRQPDPLYTAPEPRRLLAEQVVDSLFATTGKPIVVEPLCLDLNGRRDIENGTDLKTPHRAWMLASLSNERDRPSLSLPRLQALSDVMTALGWRGARQDPASSRDIAPNTLQPAIMANGNLSGWLTRLSDDHPLTQIAIQADSPEALVEHLFLRLLTRMPTSDERQAHSAYLSTGFADRMNPTARPNSPRHQAPRFVTWTNHLLPQSDVDKQELALEAQRGEPATTRLRTEWRQRCEDVIWAILNSSEVLYRP